MVKIKRWYLSKEDLRTLKSLARHKTPAPKIAKQLKRSFLPSGISGLKRGF